MQARVLLCSHMVKQLIVFSDRMNEEDFATVVALSWAFLLREAAEALPTQAGNSDDAVSLAAHRHSAVWVTDDMTLCLRRQRRKHRPLGSF